ncbi:laminin subunit alpha-1-like [Lucilia sericata]|uniref:laminin subunit alpha-1-like n=1 Tax=Lucilia sericata TaxID=13632 RepID=UPI0018A82C84|nr:laminin subunit alpha-1-like [Lucilia sericata]
MFSTTTKSKQRPLRDFNKPFNLQLRLLRIFCSLLLMLNWQATPSHTKDLMQHRVRQQQQQQLHHYRQQEDLLRHFNSKSGVNNATTTYNQDFETSVVSWTGAKLTNSPATFLSAQSAASVPTELLQRRRLEHLKQDEQQEQLAYSESQLQQQLGNKRRKTKSGLLIESNIEMDYTDLQQSSTSTSLDYDTEAEMLKAMATTAANSYNSGHSYPKQERKRNRQHHQSQRKRNGRNGGGGGGAGQQGFGGGNNGQRQKLQRNALRLLNSHSDSLTSSSLDNSHQEGGLFPQLFNVATRASITVNATCGQNGREEYCKLVDAYPHKKWATQCGICNAHSSDVAKHRPIESVISNVNMQDQWWQSPTLQYGRNYEYITITLDLKQIYQVFYVMLKSANSPRPASWILEKSLDGYNFQAWQYFGRSELDCKQRYNLPAQNGKYVFQNDTEVICTTQFSKALPLENGELHVSLLKNRPGAMEQTQELMDFITARYIRIRFQGMHSTANLDNSVYWQLDAHSLEKRSFYSLKQIRVSARLDCHGHAEKTKELAEKYKGQKEFSGLESTLQCECQHNTCGNDCSQCCPLYQDKPFRNGTMREAHQCEICQCNDHAETCIYDRFLERGVCQDCRNNTTGNECEFCLNGFYRPQGALRSEACLPCECNTKGSTGLCHAEGGSCICREGFQGRKCEECLPGFYGEDCLKCECDGRGTLADSECAGVCVCKANVEGDTCNLCKEGFYDLSSENPEGCSPCWCSGLEAGCSSAQLSTLAFETLNDWKITDITRSQTAVPVLDSDTNFLGYGMYDLSDVEAIYWQAPQGYLGNRLTSYGSRLSIQVNWVTIRGDTSGKPTSGPNVILFGKNGLKIAYGDEEFTRGSSATINITLEQSGWYHVPAQVKDIKTRLRRNEYHGSQVSRAQFLAVLTNLEALLVRAAFHTDQVETNLERVIIYTGGLELGGPPSSKVEQCRCPSGYTGLSCESCDFGFIRVYENSSDHHEVGRCKPCPCNGHSNSCDLQSGGCGNCMHNTYGERCERCQRGYYGNPLHGTPHDCKPCACPLLAASNNFSPSCQLKSYAIMDINPIYGVVENTEYICTQCPPGYTGDHCEMCDDGYYGKPTELGSSCQPCACDGGPCDVFTGRCIVCEGNTEGWHCERCKMGYWGDPSMGCEPCDCFSEGSDSSVCDSTDGQCLCKPRYSGQKCDECAEGYAQIDMKCAPCSCNEWGSIDPHTCDPDNGQCQCKPGVQGLKCNECEEGYFGLKAESYGCVVIIECRKELPLVLHCKAHYVVKETES